MGLATNQDATNSIRGAEIETPNHKNLPLVLFPVSYVVEAELAQEVRKSVHAHCCVKHWGVVWRPKLSDADQVGS